MNIAMKKAQTERSVSIIALPKELQPTLTKSSLLDGDGCVAPWELARAAELHKDYKNQVRRQDTWLSDKTVAILCTIMAVLLTVLLLTVITIVLHWTGACWQWLSRRYSSTTVHLVVSGERVWQVF